MKNLLISIPHMHANACDIAKDNVFSAPRTELNGIHTKCMADVDTMKDDVWHLELAALVL